MSNSPVVRHIDRPELLLSPIQTQTAWGSVVESLKLARRSKTLKYSCNGRTNALVEETCKCVGCLEDTCIGIGYCRQHLHELMQLRIVRSSKRGYNAGLTIQAFNMEKLLKSAPVFVKGDFI